MNPCEECVSGDVLRHKHTKNPSVCECEDCGKSFTRDSSMKRHQRTTHKKTAQFPCHCGCVFTRKEGLKSHYMRKHLQVLNVEAQSSKLNKGCDQPDKTCTSDYKCVGCVSGHVLRHKHTKNPAICACEDCGETFTQHDNMRRHMRTIHEKTESYTCHCGEVFTRKEGLHSHYMRVHLLEISIEAMRAVPEARDTSQVYEQKFTTINNFFF